MSMQGREAIIHFVREKLREIGASAFIVPTADAHQSEYVSGHDKLRQFASGFTGSAGTIIITTPDLSEKCQLFTDGRYHEQAAKEIDDRFWELQKSGLPNVLTPPAWLVKSFETVKHVPMKAAYDPAQFSVNGYAMFKNAFGTKIDLVPIEHNFVAQAWDILDPSSRPPASTSPIEVQSSKFAGLQTAVDKIRMVRIDALKQNGYATIFSALDDIAWLFNLRGSDIEFNPVFMSYAIVTCTETYLFVDDSPCKTRLREAKDVLQPLFSEANEVLHIVDYNEITNYLQILAKTTLNLHKEDKPAMILYDANKTNMMIYNTLAEHGAKILLQHTLSCVTQEKAIKNESEINGMINCHIRDAVAVCSFFAFLETQLSKLPSRECSPEEQQASPYNEHTLAEILASYRAKQELFKGLSFDTISSIGSNGAVIHYKPPCVGSKPITTGKIYLLDSGGQYQDGTTDITRTVFLSRPSTSKSSLDTDNNDNETDYHPSKEQKECYTLVLQGHLALRHALFPDGTVGPTLDVLARLPLWKHGLDYAHGTGHGVGSYLNVHEGPMGIGPIGRSSTALTTKLLPGMVVSNEPGYYKTGEYGIRIENLVHVVPFQTTEKPYYTFADLTLVPYDRQLIMLDLLSEEEIQWINEYHSECRKHVIGYIESKANDTTIFPTRQDADLVLQWILKNTESLKKL